MSPLIHKVEVYGSILCSDETVTQASFIVNVKTGLQIAHVTKIL